MPIYWQIFPNFITYNPNNINTKVEYVDMIQGAFIIGLYWEIISKAKVID